MASVTAIVGRAQTGRREPMLDTAEGRFGATVFRWHGPEVGFEFVELTAKRNRDALFGPNGPFVCSLSQLMLLDSRRVKNGSSGRTGLRQLSGVAEFTAK